MKIVCSKYPVIKSPELQVKSDISNTDIEIEEYKKGGGTFRVPCCRGGYIGGGIGGAGTGSRNSGNLLNFNKLTVIVLVSLTSAISTM